MSLVAHPASASGDHGVSRPGIGEILHRCWTAYRGSRARRRTAARLSQLDDRTLRDIGIDRSEIDSIVTDRRSERLRRYEEGWWKPFED